MRALYATRLERFTKHWTLASRSTPVQTPVASSARPGRQGDRGAGTVQLAEYALGAGSWRARLAWPAVQLSDGAPADLVVSDADPRVDLAVLSVPRHVILRGAILG